jgi:hypothetical protein
MPHTWWRVCEGELPRKQPKTANSALKVHALREQAETVPRLLKVLKHDSETGV